ncbi:MAG: 4'-phosphopantetheinyl transferase family protein [Solirubrobacteraceae bacterium]
MSQGEREREARFRFERDRRLYRLARACTRTVLSRYAAVHPSQLRFRAGPAGKPEIASPIGLSLTFSLAHTHGMVALVVSRDRAVGVDVEHERRFIPSEIDLPLLGASEAAGLSLLAPDCRPARFTEHWTLKESYAKARGTGLELPLDRCQFVIDGDRIGLRGDCQAAQAPPLWWFSLPPRAAGYVTAVAASLHAADEALDLEILPVAPQAER